MAMAMAMAARGEAMSIDDLLPPEIWRQILTNLPAKSILRCRCVCKTWYSLISSPDFITYHAAQTLNHSTTNRVLVLRTDSTERLYKFSSHDESFVERHEHDDLPEQFGGSAYIVGSCNGLVCLKKFSRTATGSDDSEVHSFLIWNPSTRKSVQLPVRHSTPDYKTLYLTGFGFDCKSGDYKVLRSGYLMSQRLVPVVSEIFDMRKGVWRDSSPPITPRYVMTPDSPVYFHGSLHWMGYDSYEKRYNCVIASFNLSSEASREMGMPGDAGFKLVQDHDRYYMSANNGLLSVALLRMQQGDVIQDCCTVWSMKEYGVTESWTKLFNIELPYAQSHLGLVRFWENGQVIIAAREGGNVLIGYNPKSRTSKALLSVDEYIFKVFFYKESLVLP